jgi:hypothetical protein
MEERHRAVGDHESVEAHVARFQSNRWGRRLLAVDLLVAIHRSSRSNLDRHLEGKQERSLISCGRRA